MSAATFSRTSFRLRPPHRLIEQTPEGIKRIQRSLLASPLEQSPATLPFRNSVIPVHTTVRSFSPVRSRLPAAFRNRTGTYECYDEHLIASLRRRQNGISGFSFHSPHQPARITSNHDVVSYASCNQEMISSRFPTQTSGTHATIVSVLAWQPQPTH